ncbi:uncharacterized protein N7503_007236 [Penicillium pulvis]|uniref:uncharacterized protein n=1 Tax=Penicillium pulvis TaxID=1562058 RepID=UPI0025489727|nr:uncharacterized protein N7503_007236 [Penicillium pulvis]KAJ5797940.1 hypothetical protein N7503_007236 [Penicillium pulvis]
MTRPRHPGREGHISEVSANERSAARLARTEINTPRGYQNQGQTPEGESSRQTPLDEAQSLFAGVFAEHSQNSNAAAGISPVNSRQTDDARNLFRRELDANSNLPRDRRQILDSALYLVTKYTNASYQIENPIQELCTGGIESSPDEPNPELYYMMLNDHISKKTLERFCLALVRNTVTGQKKWQFKLCVLVKAILHYAAAGLRCLEKIDMMTSPNLLMLQSLLSGAVLVQLLGDSARAWMLTAFASRVLVCLGYHTLSLEMLGNDDISIDVRHCIYWCYYLDKTLSTVLLRPSSLPELCLEPAKLVPTSPSEPLSMEVKILVELAGVQDVSLVLLLGGNKLEKSGIPELIRSLQDRMRAIGHEISEARDAWSNAPELSIEMDALEFTYNSILTTVLRLGSTMLHDVRMREECLHNARKSIISMRSLQTKVSVANELSLDVIFWTALLNPLTPFFVVFCNVVATSNLQDLQLLRQITANLSRIKERNPFLANLHKFLLQFVSLCAELDVAEVPETSLSCQLPNEASTSAGTMDHDQVLRPTAELRTPISDQAERVPAQTAITWGGKGLETAVHSRPASQPHGLAIGGPALELRLDPNSMWDDSLMWDLFNTQPSIEWCDMNFPGEFMGS